MAIELGSRLPVLRPASLIKWLKSLFVRLQTGAPHLLALITPDHQPSCQAVTVTVNGRGDGNSGIYFLITPGSGQAADGDNSLPRSSPSDRAGRDWTFDCQRDCLESK